MCAFLNRKKKNEKIIKNLKMMKNDKFIIITITINYKTKIENKKIYRKSLFEK